MNTQLVAQPPGSTVQPTALPARLRCAFLVLVVGIAGVVFSSSPAAAQAADDTCSVTLYTSTLENNVYASWSPVRSGDQLIAEFDDGSTEFTAWHTDALAGPVTIGRQPSDVFDPNKVTGFFVSRSSLVGGGTVPCALTVDGDPTNVPPATRRPDACQASVDGNIATITWTAAPEDQASRYLLEANGEWAGSTAASGGETSFVVSPVSARYGVKVRDVLGNFTHPRACTVTTPPPIEPPPAFGEPVRPVSCMVEVNGSSASIDLVAADADNASRYLLYRRENQQPWQWTASVPAPELSFTWQQADGVDYEYAVKTRGFENNFTALTECDDGSGVEPPPPLPGVAPAACSTVEQSAGAFEITFTPAPTDNAARYLLYRSEDGGSWQWTASISADAPLLFVYDDVAAGVSYDFAVKTRGTDNTFTRLTACPMRD